MHQGWTWIALIVLVSLVILAIWWAINNSSSCGMIPIGSSSEEYTFLEEEFPDPTNRMCWCRPLPFQDFHCENLGLKRICCDDFDLEGRRCYCCTGDSRECKQKACSVPY